MLVAKTQRPTSKRLRVVYYLWSAEGPLRITDRLHRALVERSLALPQFAATKQKIIETIVQPLTRDSYTLSARGLMYSFDPKGFIEETIKTEGVIHLPRFGSSEPKLVDLTPKIKARRVREKKTWTPTKSMLDIIWSDVDPSRPRGPRIPMLRPCASP